MKKSSDFFIIKIRCSASKYYLKKFHNHENVGIQKQWDAAGKYLDFFWKFFTYVSGITQKDFTIEYFLGARDCATEVLNETYGIHISTVNNYYEYFIPIEKVEIINWVKSNIGDIPYKIIKKAPMTVVVDLLKNPISFHRTMYKTTPEMRAKLKGISPV